MEVTRLLLKITKLWPNQIINFLQFVLVASMFVCIFCSGIAMFFVREILFAPCIVVEIDWSIASLLEKEPPKETCSKKGWGPEKKPIFSPEQNKNKDKFLLVT